MKNTKEHERFVVLGEDFFLHYRGNSGIPVQHDFGFVFDFAPIQRRVPANMRSLFCGGSL